MTELETDWFPNSSNVTVYLAPKTAHVINVATSAADIYKKMFAYLEEHGL